MTYAQALMIVRDVTGGYTVAEIKEAVDRVLSAPGASADDWLDACNALGWADLVGRHADFSPGARCSDLDAHPFSGAQSAKDY